jgi:aspartate racemase
MAGLTVGVIGGMGPAATTQFIARVQALTPARGDQDHLRLLVDCNPQVPDRNVAATAGGPSPAQVLASMARGLETAGAQLLAMPCNAAHAYASDIAGAVSIPFVNLIEAVANEAVAQAQGGAVGLIAADACLEAGLYQEAFARRGAELLIPSAKGEAAFMALLYRIKSGDLGAEVQSAMADLAQDLIARGAAVVVAGCTEVPLVLKPGAISVPLADSIEILAARTVEAALARGQE